MEPTSHGLHVTLMLTSPGAPCDHCLAGTSLTMPTRRRRLYSPIPQSERGSFERSLSTLGVGLRLGSGLGLGCGGVLGGVLGGAGVGLCRVRVSECNNFGRSPSTRFPCRGFNPGLADWTLYSAFACSCLCSLLPLLAPWPHQSHV